jgi:hypothetical protein
MDQTKDFPVTFIPLFLLIDADSDREQIAFIGSIA